jgi:hypothetical protein
VQYAAAHFQEAETTSSRAPVCFPNSIPQMSYKRICTVNTIQFSSEVASAEIMPSESKNNISITFLDNGAVRNFLGGN